MRSSSSWVRQHGLHINTHLSTAVNFGSSAREKHRLEKRYLPSSASVERYAIAESHFSLLVNMIYEPMLSAMDRRERGTVEKRARTREREQWECFNTKDRLGNWTDCHAFVVHMCIRSFVIDTLYKYSAYVVVVAYRVCDAFHIDEMFMRCTYARMSTENYLYILNMQLSVFYKLPKAKRGPETNLYLNFIKYTNWGSVRRTDRTSYAYCEATAERTEKKHENENWNNKWNYEKQFTFLVFRVEILRVLTLSLSFSLSLV